MGTAKKRRPVDELAAATPLAARLGGESSAVTLKAPLRPHQCQRHLRLTVAAAYRDIVAGFVDEAKAGSCQHLKMATEVVASKKRVRAAKRVKGPSELMLEKFDEMERARNAENEP